MPLLDHLLLMLLPLLDLSTLMLNVQLLVLLGSKFPLSVWLLMMLLDVLMPLLVKLLGLPGTLKLLV